MKVFKKIEHPENPFKTHSLMTRRILIKYLPCCSFIYIYIYIYMCVCVCVCVCVYAFLSVMDGFIDEIHFVYMCISICISCYISNYNYFLNNVFITL